MFDAEHFRPSLIPALPGVYLYRDRFGKIIYVGKARNLRKRMSHYFQGSSQRLSDPKFRSLVNTIAHYEYQTVKTEDEALILESKLIKDYMPQYNILLRDDKRFQLIRMNLNDPFPTLSLCRFKRDDGARYWGPFPHGMALRETVDFLRRHFRLKSCKALHPDEDCYKHCMAANVKDCSAPCVQKVSAEAYQKQVEETLHILSGSPQPLCEELTGIMKKYAEKHQFERAARTRDIIENLQVVFGHKNRSFKNASAPALIGDAGVEDLQKALGLNVAPHCIEGFDNSHIAGHFPVSSMVCFINGKPARDRYRRFRLKDAIEGYPDDYAAMHEVLTRHYARRIAENKPMPDLILIDGGKGQLHAACDVLKNLGLENQPIISLAKRQEEIFIPGREHSILLDTHSPALRLLQAVRDESHRFVITYNRTLRQQKITESILDTIEGIGPTRKTQLLVTFGSIANLRKATPEEIVARVPKIGLQLAERLAEQLRKAPSGRGKILNELRPE